MICKYSEEFHKELVTSTKDKLKSLSDKEITSLIYKLLWDEYTVNFKKERDWVVLQEGRIGTGYKALNQRSCNFMAISSANGNDVIAYEVKASRADFLSDLKATDKQKALRCFANYFYYVAPAGIVSPEELPCWAGLQELCFFPGSKEWGLYEHSAAPRLQNLPPTWAFVAACIRNSRETQVMQLKNKLEEQKNTILQQKQELDSLRMRKFILSKEVGNEKSNG